jgi:hypothetical protein
METFPPSVPKKSNLLEQAKKGIEERVAYIKENPIRFGIAEQLKLEYIRLLHKENITEEEHARLVEIRKWFNDAMMSVETLTEFRLALESFGCTEEYITGVIAHENAHGNRAAALKAKHYGYTLLAMYDEQEKEFVLQPSCSLDVIDSWSNWRKNRVKIAYTKAPEDYGNSLSSKDEIDLKYLNKDKAKLKKKE